MDGDGILVHATIPVDPGEDHDFVIVDLPDIEQAATILHAARWTTSCRPSRH